MSTHAASLAAVSVVAAMTNALDRFQVLLDFDGLLIDMEPFAFESAC